MPIPPFGWQNLPNTTTPVNAQNLEAMHAAAGTYADSVGSAAIGGLSVKTYGAVGNNVTDDSAAIAACVAAAQAQGARQVIFEAGRTYLCHTPQNSAPTPGSGGGAGIPRAVMYFTGLTDIEFVGNGATLTTDVAQSTLLEVRDSTRVIVQGLILRAVGSRNGRSDSDVAGSAVRYTNVAHGTIRNNRITNAAYSAVYLTGGSAHTLVADNHVYTCAGNGINEDSLNGTTGGADTLPLHNRIAGNRLDTVATGTAAGGIVVDNNTNRTHTQVHGNSIEASGSAGIWCPNPACVEIIGNTIRNAAWWGIRVFANVGATVTRDVIVSNNIVDNCGIAGVNNALEVAGSNGVELLGVVIHGNTVRNAGVNGIYIYDCSHAIVTGNYSEGATQIGIYCYADAARTGLVLKGNIAYAVNSSGIVIEAHGAITYRMIEAEGNIVRLTGAHGILITQTTGGTISGALVAGNTVDNPNAGDVATFDGIQVNATRAVVSNNTIDASIHNQRWGVNVASGSCAVFNNVFNGTFTSGQHNAGSVLTVLRTPYVTEDDLLTAGESTIRREDSSSSGISMTSQTLRLAYFTARKSETVNNMKAVVGTAAGATPTLVRFALYTVDGSGNLTLVASTANDTTLLASPSAASSKALSGSYAKIAGQRYAAGLLVVTAATLPQVYGNTSLISSEIAVAPQLCGSVTGQSDLPNPTIASGSVSQTTQRPYLVIYP